MCCGSDAVKARNLRANPSVSVSLQDGADPLVADGTAQLHARPFPHDVAAAFQAALDWDITTDEPYDCLIEISVDRWLMGDPRR